VKRPSIVEFVTDPRLLGLSLSPAQETLLRAIYGLDLGHHDQLDLWRACTGRELYAAQPFGEVTVLAGARAGKDSRIAAPIVCFEALFGGHEKHLARGERAVIPLVAQDARATKIAFGYVRGYLTGSKLLASRVEEVLSLEIALTNRVAIQCFPCTLKSLRGWSVPAGVMDELGFWRLEGQADSDVEVQASIRRGMLSFASPRLVKISTPYMKSGVLFEDFKAAFGKDDADRLVWRAPSVLMNPSLRAERLERERRLDPSRFAREYEAEFAEDLDAFLPAAWVDAAIVPGRHELPPLDGVSYYAAVDASGGGADAFTLSIVHTEGEASSRRVVQDVMRGWRGSRSGSVDLEGIVGEIVEVLRPYHVCTVRGDRYSAGWVRQAFERHAGVTYETAEDKSAAYIVLEPLFAQGRVEVLDHPQLVRELKNLERRPRPGGKVVVDHPHGQHDDHANALALAAAAATKSEGAWPEDVGPFSVGSRTSPWNVGGPSIDLDSGERVTRVGDINFIGAVPADGPSLGRSSRSRWRMG